MEYESVTRIELEWNDITKSFQSHNIDGLELNEAQRACFFDNTPYGMQCNSFEVALEKGASTIVDIRNYSRRSLYLSHKETSYQNIIMTIYPWGSINTGAIEDCECFAEYNLGDKLERLLWQTAVGKFMRIDALEDVEFVLYLKGG